MFKFKVTYLSRWWKCDGLNQFEKNMLFFELRDYLSSPINVSALKPEQKSDTFCL